MWKEFTKKSIFYFYGNGYLPLSPLLFPFQGIADVPANAMAYGDTWICNNGYKKQGNSCKKINVLQTRWHMVILGYVTMVTKEIVVKI